MPNTKKRNSRLGRGLNALLMQPVAVLTSENPEGTNGDDPGNRLEKGSTSISSNIAEVGGLATETGNPMAVRFVPVAQIVPNPHQPRQQFDETALNQLAQSIQSEGVMQPIIVRPRTNPQNGTADTFELVAGERRWRASQIAQLETIPAIVRDLDEQQTAEWSLIENLQREDLNPLERAFAFKRLIEQFGMNHAEVAQHVGVERPTISNSLRLLDLEPKVQQMLINGLLSNGQAKAIAGIADLEQQVFLANRAVRQGLNVRQVEQAARKIIASTTPGSIPVNNSDNNQLGHQSMSSRQGHLADLEQQITQQLGTKATVKPGRKKGTGSLKLEFYSLDQFDELINRLGIELT